MIDTSFLASPSCVRMLQQYDMIPLIDFVLLLFFCNTGRAGWAVRRPAIQERGRRQEGSPAQVDRNHRGRGTRACTPKNVQVFVVFVHVLLLVV